MFNKIKVFLSVPKTIREEFWQECLRINRVSLMVISIMIFGMELYNMARVLFLSSSGLGTVNNRIYFGMYCSLFLGAAFFLVFQYLWRDKSIAAQWLVQYSAVYFFFVWHICLNSYDVSRDPEAETHIFITAILGLGIFIRMPSWYAAACFIPGYMLFMLLGGYGMDAGAKVNLTITSIVALAISFTCCHHLVTDVTHRGEIRRMNMQLQKLLQKDPLTGLLNKTASQNCVEAAMEADDIGESWALYMVDLDDFKDVNDNFGHPCGDYVLEETARLLREIFPEAGGIGRVGGDEFMLLLSCTGQNDMLEAKGRRLIREISAIKWKGQRINTSCSVGILRIIRRKASYEELYEAADETLYEAKRRGKACCFLREFS